MWVTLRDTKQTATAHFIAVSSQQLAAALRVKEELKFTQADIGDLMTLWWMLSAHYLNPYAVSPHLHITQNSVVMGTYLLNC